MSTLTATIVTNKGDISLDLFAEKTPKTVANFINLAQRGFYKDLNFHRVINDFMIQGDVHKGLELVVQDISLKMSLGASS